MQIKLVFLIGIVILLIGYYLNVLYWTLKKKQRYHKTPDAQELYLRSKAPYLLLFGNLFRPKNKYGYKIFKKK